MARLVFIFASSKIKFYFARRLLLLAILLRLLNEQLAKLVQMRYISTALFTPKFMSFSKKSSSSNFRKDMQNLRITLKS